MQETLQLTYRPVEVLLPYARNARTHSDAHIAQIAASIREFGWTNPVLVDGGNGIIAGHGRVLAARKLRMTEVPVIELAGMSDAQKRAYILADNQLALNAGWDKDLLALELADLKALAFDLPLTGFNQEELATLLRKLEGPADGLTDPDAAPETPAEPWVRPGDLFVLGAHRVLCGDATDVDHVARLMDTSRAR
jgi:ParB-like chromosome segregation protein Spo0J